jgi:hypothetical protein
MTSKENKIREVYGDKYELLCPDNNGWINLTEAVKIFKVVSSSEFEFGSFDKGNPTKCRDLQLKDIEHNNDWIRTDEKFPRISAIYVFLSKNKISHEVRLQFPLSKEEENHYRNDFTHFRVPKHHPLPIY